VLSEARHARLSRLQRTALANRLVGTVERLERAGLAHPTLQDMAGEVEQDLAPLDLTAAPDHRREPNSDLDAGTSPTGHVGPGLHFPPPEPPDPDLNREI